MTAAAFRIDDLKSLVLGRSICPQCKHQLRFWDLFPIFSWVFLKGHCRYCKKKISFQYSLTELVSSALLLGLYLKFGFTVSSLLIFLSLSLLIIASLNDIKDQEVGLPIFIVGIFLALVFRFWGNFNQNTLFNLLYSVAVFVSLPLLFALISREKWMGYGDSLFALWVGSFVIFPASVFSLFSAFFIGAVFGIMMLVVYGKKKENKIPFGPFLALGGLVGLFLGQGIINFYFRFLGF